VIDKVRTLIQDEGLFKKLGIVHEISGVSASTLNNWFHGETRRPQHITVAAVVTALGYREEFVKEKEIDIEAERKAAAAWLERQEKKLPTRTGKKAKKKRTNGRGA
jgi:transcriptional regulator with XRE-family HTH domain